MGKGSSDGRGGVGKGIGRIERAGHQVEGWKNYLANIATLTDQTHPRRTQQAINAKTD
jgi:hypothetical protein